MTRATAYWVVAPGEGDLRSEELPPVPKATRVRAEFSAVSAGTERLVGLGRVPAALGAAMACRGMAGSFALPVKYGYSLVGIAESGPWRGRRVFTMHPHQDVADVADAHALPLPADLPAARATLIPNLETALNAVWDADLRGVPAASRRSAVELGAIRCKDGAMAGDSCRSPIAIFGAGAVGLLLAFVLHELHGVRATLVEPRAGRRALAAGLPFVGAALPLDAVPAAAFALVFHASGNPRGLSAALAALGFEGRVLELSWYGDQAVALELGGNFHYLRQRIEASQVGHVAASKRTTHGPSERLAEVVRLLAQPSAAALDALLAPAVPFAELPARMRALYRGADDEIVPLIQFADHGARR